MSYLRKSAKSVDEFFIRRLRRFTQIQNKVFLDIYSQDTIPVRWPQGFEGFIDRAA